MELTNEPKRPQTEIAVLLVVFVALGGNKGANFEVFFFEKHRMLVEICAKKTREVGIQTSLDI